MSSKAKKQEKIRDTLAEILNQCQNTFAVHQANAKRVVKLYQLDAQIFQQEFFNHLNRVLLVFQREVAVERLVQFIITVAAKLQNLKWKAQDDKPSQESEEQQTAAKKATRQRNAKKATKEKDKEKKSPKKKRKGKSEDSDEDLSGEGEEEEMDDKRSKDAENTEFPIALLKHLLEATGSKEKAARFRSCQLIAGLVSKMEEIDNSIWDDVEDRMMARLKDKFPSIRTQAVTALAKLQNPESRADPITQEYLNLLKNDSSKEVRKAILHHMAISVHTLQDVLQRTRDINDEVRKVTFEIITEKIPFNQLNSSHRISILKDGLNDRDESVKKECTKMLCTTWLQACNNNPVKLLQFLGVDDRSNEEHIETVLKCMFQNVNSEYLDIELKLDDLDPETAIYWRMYCEHLRSDNKEDALENVMPPISGFCDIIKAYQKDEFIVKQLLLQARLYDFADEVGRRNLSSLIVKMLLEPQQQEDMLKIMIKLLAKIHTPEEFIHIISEATAEIQDPIEDTKWEKGSPATWLRCLTFVEQLLENINKVTPNLMDLKDSIIIPAVTDLNVTVRNAGIKCLGLLGLLDVASAKRDLHLFLTVIKADRENLKLTAVKIVFDFIMTYGLATFAGIDGEQVPESQEFSQLSQPSIPLDEKEKDTYPVIKVLNQLISHSNRDIRTAVAEGFAKIMFAEYYESPPTVARMLVLFFDPATQQDDHLRQCLSVFFNIYAHDHKIICSAFMLAIRTFLNASRRSSLREVSITKVGQFMLFLLTEPNAVASSPNSYHEQLSLEIMEEIFAYPQGPDTKHLIKLLNSLRLSKSTPQETIKVLHFLTQALIQNLSDKLLIKPLNKLAETLTGLDQKPEQPLAEDKLKELNEKVNSAFAKPAYEDKNEPAPVAEPNEEQPAPTRADKTKKPATPIQSQKEYFNTIDNFEVKGMPKKSSLRKSSDKKKVTIEDDKEKEELAKRNKDLEEELARLKRMLANQGKSGATEVKQDEGPTEPSSKKQKKASETEISPSKEKEDINQMPPPATQDTQKRRDRVYTTSIGAPAPSPQSARKAPPMQSIFQDKPADTPSKVPAKKDTKKGSNKPSSNKELDVSEEEEVEEDQPKTRRVSPRKRDRVEEAKEETEEVEKESPNKKGKTKKPEESTDRSSGRKRKEAEPTKAKKNAKKQEEDVSAEEASQEASEEEEATTKRSKSQTAKGTTATPKKTSPKQACILLVKLIVSQKQVEASPIPVITAFVPEMSPSPARKPKDKPNTPRSKTRKVVVSFSGFKESDKVYTLKFKEDLTNRAYLLGGEVRNGETFDSKITHIITPPNTRTMKTLAGALTQRWLVSPNWLLDSTVAGYFLDETPYGKQFTNSPFEGKKVYISGSFKIENRDKNFKDQNYRTLIEQLGRGTITRHPEEANVTLIGLGETSYSGEALTWSQFFDIIQPNTE